MITAQSATLPNVRRARFGEVLFKCGCSEKTLLSAANPRVTHIYIYIHPLTFRSPLSLFLSFLPPCIGCGGDGGVGVDVDSDAAFVTQLPPSASPAKPGTANLPWAQAPWVWREVNSLGRWTRDPKPSWAPPALRRRSAAAAVVDTGRWAAGASGRALARRREEEEVAAALVARRAWRIWVLVIYDRTRIRPVSSTGKTDPTPTWVCLQVELHGWVGGWVGEKAGGWVGEKAGGWVGG